MMRSTFVALLGLVLCLFLVFVAGDLRAQIADGSIGGSVTDPSDASVVGSLVTATNVATGVQSKTNTTSTGDYLFPVLAAGTYTVAVEQPGFRRAITVPLVLHAGAKLRVDMKMEMGQSNQSIEVVATQPLVNATTTDLGTVIEGREVSELPFNGRTFTQILTLEPGWNQGTQSAQRGGVSLNGMSGFGNNWLMDGVDMSFGENNGVGAGGAGFNDYLITNISMDAIQELKTTTGGASAEFGRAAGGTINLTTKSGTDRFHGALWEYFRNDKLDTSTFFANLNGLEKPSLRQNQFGGNLGGPILRNRLFFFFNYEGARTRRGLSLSGAVPTQAFYDQMTSPKMVTYMQKWFPLPNAATSDPLTGLFNHNGAEALTEDMTLTRIDGAFGKHRLSFRMAYGNQSSLIPDVSPFIGSSYPLPSRNYAGAWTATFKPTLVNQVRVAYNSTPVRRTYHAIGKYSNLNKNLPGVGPFTLDPDFPGISMYPGPYNIIMPQDNLAANAPTKTFDDDLTWEHGAHTVKTGFSFRRTNSTRIQYGEGVWYGFRDQQELINGVASFFELDIGNPGTSPFNYWTYGGYVQDNWKINRRLTLNYGLHYDYFQVLSGPIGLATSDPFGATTPLGTPLWKANKTNFSPRVGLVYLLTGDGKTVVRLGGGSYYGADLPFFYFASHWLAPNVPTFPVLAPSDFPPSVDLTFPNLNWNFVQGVRDDPSTIPPGLAPGNDSPDPNHHPDQYSMQYNLTVERELNPTLVASVSYVGNRTLHMESATLANPIDPATGIRPHAEQGPVWLYGQEARLWNNQLQAVVRKKTSHGLSFDAFYTWGKSMAYRGADAVWNRDNVTQDFNNPKGAIGPTAGEVRHRFSSDFIWAIPTGGLTNPFARAILGGWSLTGIVGARTGGALNITTGLDAVGNGRSNGQRPDGVPGVSPYLHGSDRLAFLNPAAYDTATPVAQHRFGNLGYDTVHGPGAFTFDMGVRKSWKIRESQEFSFRCELFNALNHVVLGDPSTSTTSSIFGQITSGSNGREIQLAMRYSF